MLRGWTGHVRPQLRRIRLRLQSVPRVDKPAVHGVAECNTERGAHSPAERYANRVAHPPADCIAVDITVIVTFRLAERSSKCRADPWPDSDARDVADCVPNESSDSLTEQPTKRIAHQCPKSISNWRPNDVAHVVTKCVANCFTKCVAKCAADRFANNFAGCVAEHGA